MRFIVRHPAAVALASLAGAALMGCATAGAQGTLERRIAALGDGSAQFNFASRDGVCGNGRTFFRVDDDGWYQTSSSGMTFSSDGVRSDNVCARGPVRVVISKAGRDIVKIETYAGPLATDPEAGRDLGTVPAREAAQYLLSIAATAEGRPAREAMTPAMLADSAAVSAQLLAIATDKTRSRDLRRSAISWASRRRAEPGGPGAPAVARALNDIVRDRDEGEPIRQQALATISSFNRGEGIPTLIGFASDADVWIATQAMRTLARSGDPRARAFTREIVKRDDLPDEVRSEVIRGLGGDYATGADYRLLRELYPRLTNDRDRDAVISTLASAGGRENADWLVTLARSPTETVARRRRVINALAKFDDPKIKDALKDLISK
ncbi:MAG TPA: HEAT repeat domain-containing protein [Gemmatimonadaceae bacterium]|nr:HEAT repeat domain-containing protein [Gemmatimonadaceae bacterium]